VSTIHLHPTAPLAPRVLLPGDPGRALLLAQTLLREPKMFNHHRGLWGYTGAAADGAPLTVQATGMGGPSAAIVVTELVELGARTLVRVGTCGSLVEDLRLGSLVTVRGALPFDGTSVALGARDGAAVEPDAGLHAALREGAAEALDGVVVSTDLFYRPGEEFDPVAEWSSAGAVAVEMEAATLLQLGRRLGVATACVLAVTDELARGSRRRISEEELRAAAEAVGRAGAAAVGAA
jgi:uridine phosphorylase